MYTYVRSQSSVRILETTGYLVLLNGRFDIFDQSNDRVVFFVSIRQSSLKLTVSINQSLDFFNSVHNEHVHKIFTGAVQPVVERLIKRIIITFKCLGGI